jgi:hypothetical protein
VIVSSSRWMDGLNVSEIKYSHAGHKSGLICTTQMKNCKIKEETNSKQSELDSTKRRNVHKNQGVTVNLPLASAPQRPKSVTKMCTFLEISDLGSHKKMKISYRIY